IEDPGKGQRHDGRDTEMAKRLGCLFARGAKAKIAPGDENIAGPCVRREIRPHRFQAMRRDLGDAATHIFSGGELIGVDIVPDQKDASAHRSFSRKGRGSVIRPVIAEAATVSGDPSHTLELAAPMRPWKLRAVEEMQVTS